VFLTDKKLNSHILCSNVFRKKRQRTKNLIFLGGELKGNKARKQKFSAMFSFDLERNNKKEYFGAKNS
jgi:hypothetical protein